MKHCVTDINIFAEFVQFLNGIGKIDLLLKVGDPNVAAEKWKKGDLVIGTTDGTLVWQQNGKCHREDGPAVIYADGSQEWYNNGVRHRDETDAFGAPLPALICASGRQVWVKNGLLHRDDGPAIIWANGSQEWWKNGKKVD